MDQDYSIVDLAQNYYLKVPKHYSIHSGTGDDTHFVQIYTEDGRIHLGHESGASDKDVKKTEYLEKKFENLERLRDLEDNTLWIAYSSMNTSLRDIKGAVYVEYDNVFLEILTFSCSSTKLDQVRQLIHSIEKK